MASSDKFVFLSTLVVVLFLLPVPASSHDAANHKPVLEYHGSPVLSGDLKIAAIWYGTVGRVQKSAIHKFTRSLNKDNTRGATCVGMVESYQSAVPGGPKTSPTIRVRVARKITDKSYSINKILTQDFIPGLIKEATGGSTHLVTAIFAAKNVSVQNLCSGKCSDHGVVDTGPDAQLYTLIGNPMLECPEACACPFYKSGANYPMPLPLQPSNKDVGTDAMVINFVAALASLVTNPSLVWFEGLSNTMDRAQVSYQTPLAVLYFLTDRQRLQSLGCSGLLSQ
ncbi:PREDICTED: protein EXORDIUM-like 2 [Nelumbo nucifera]|uniref:Protein EXORDIUM-like 2 n=1 Tax=Nelumbo nucifera TaxID=4432 RepID=A0A1U8A949_NELNU|nr:PREDICTED: protein EXORDIUM-like 2 [Nelumbo nucifera]